MKSSKVVAQQIATEKQYNDLRDDAKMASVFMVTQSTTPNTSVTIFGGYLQLLDGTSFQKNTEVKSITMPTSTKSIALISVNIINGDTVITYSAESSTPVKPTIPAGNAQVAYLYLKAGTVIKEEDDLTNSYIVDIRNPLTASGDFYTKDEVKNLAMSFTNKTLDSTTNNISANRIHFKVKMTGTNGLKGQAVQVTGYNSGEDALEVVLANNENGPANGILKQNLLVGAFGAIVSLGDLTDIDTSSFSEGDILYIGTDGNLINTQPTTGAIQQIAFVLRDHAINGAIQINAQSTLQRYSEVPGLVDVLNAKDNLAITDSRGANRPPSYYDIKKVQWDFVQDVDVGLTGLGETWVALQTIKKWDSHNSAHKIYQFAYAGGLVSMRESTSDADWSAWWQIVDTKSNQSIGGEKRFLGITMIGEHKYLHNYGTEIKFTNAGVNHSYRIVSADGLREIFKVIETDGAILRGTFTNSEHTVEPFYGPRATLAGAEADNFGYRFRDSTGKTLCEMGTGMKRFLVGGGEKFDKDYVTDSGIKTLRFGSRWEISGIPHSAQGHILQALWGDGASNPEGTSSDGGWGMEFGEHGNPYIKMIGDTTELGRSGGITNIRGGTVQVNGNSLPIGGVIKEIYIGNISGYNYYTITHGLSISQWEVEHGRYRISVSYKNGSYGRLMGHSGNDSNFEFCAWSSSNAGGTNQANFDGTYIRIYPDDGGSDARLLIYKLF